MTWTQFCKFIKFIDTRAQHCNIMIDIPAVNPSYVLVDVLAEIRSFLKKGSSCSSQDTFLLHGYCQFLRLQTERLIRGAQQQVQPKGFPSNISAMELIRKPVWLITRYSSNSVPDIDDKILHRKKSTWRDWGNTVLHQVCIKYTYPCYCVLSLTDQGMDAS